jgi:DNA-binding FrmR family transcriptional regulator
MKNNTIIDSECIDVVKMIANIKGHELRHEANNILTIYNYVVIKNDSEKMARLKNRIDNFIKTLDNVCKSI